MKYVFIVFLCISAFNTEAQNSADKSFPIYRGCNKELNYENQKECTTKKIMRFIQMSIDLELANALFPLDQSTKIQVDFIINKKGKAEQINVKAFKREMAIEAIKVIKRLPKLKQPGYKNGKAVNTPMSFTMSIYFI